MIETVVSSLCLIVLAALLAISPARANENPSGRFQTIVLSEEFHSEGAAIADIDGDGHQDVISGPFWYQGPQFRHRHAYAVVKDYSIKGYSDHFFAFARDFDGDGDIDILSVPIPGSTAVWYQNPGSGKMLWKKFEALRGVGNESPLMADIDGDGADELICIHDGQYGFAQPGDDPTEPWLFMPITDRRGYGRFTHGLGVGDVDGDGRIDLLEKDGWWQQTESPGELFRFHAVKFAESGGSQMFVADFDQDGDNDVVSVQNAHGFGLCWFERRGESDDDFLFVKHAIVGKSPGENRYGLAISQMHAVAMADVDGDGARDLITGKRFYAHGGSDPGSAQLPVLYWFRATRTAAGIEFVPMLIDSRVGVGTQLTTGDVDGNGHVDVVVGNKLGTFLMLNSGQSESIPQPTTTPRHTIGTEVFKTHVRNSQPLAPEQERASFVLPIGFEAQLVACEPEIAKPMNMAFDHLGRLWVSSSVEYPYPAPPDREARDTIKILEDTDGDGRADKITTFADKLNIPIGLYPYGDGVICYSIPNIWYLRDTNGDGKADKREVLYGPFDATRDTHGMCNAFTRGYDGWLYACHGFNNQSSVAGKDGHRVNMHSGNTFRMQPDGSRIEHFTHGQVNPFGMTFDDRGELFTADCHTKPIMLLIKGGNYAHFGKPTDAIGFVPDVMDHLHGSTAIAGLAFYQDDQFPEVYRGNAFGGNVMTSRVNRNSIKRIGSSIRAQEEADFLISGDPWFRPVDLQLGPDGALYIADFYNRIIGHYEVPLDHPGRDRHRGRIWRIVYKPTDQRRDPAPRSLRTPPQPIDDKQTALAGLSSPNLTTRMLATDLLADRFATDAIYELKDGCEDERDANRRIHSRWALLRADRLSGPELMSPILDSDPRARMHAYQMVASTELNANLAKDLIIAGFDPDPAVLRAAVIASIEHPHEGFIAAMLHLLTTGNPQDVHLRHVLRMSLVKHLSNKQWFASTAQSITRDDWKTQLLPLCLALESDFAGKYVADNLQFLKDAGANDLSSYLSFAARFASLNHLVAIVKLAEDEFADDVKSQEQLARSVLSGLQQRGTAPPPIILEWVERIARRYLGIDGRAVKLPEAQSAIAWTYRPGAGTPDRGNPWTVSTKRNSADGQQASRLHSSFPKGESLTGIYRSDPFSLPRQFSFYMAGHDGFPDKPIQHKNLVRVRDAKTHAVLKQWSPPRNDTAQPFAWQSGDHAGRDVYVELVDGDTANAYAWLAVGRFSITALNPSDAGTQRRQAAALIRDFTLEKLRPIAISVVSDSTASRQDVLAFARAIVAFEPSAQNSAVAQSLEVVGVDRPLRGELCGWLISEKPKDPIEVLGKVMKVATAAEQHRIALHLTSDRVGLGTFVSLIQRGVASPRLLIQPAAAARIASLATEEDKARIAELIKDLPREDRQLVAAMNERKSSFLRGGGNVNAGKEVFRVQCGVCHQVAGKGAAVGPNLDGIGNRGLDRVLEDVMLPNRNIDAAFKATLLMTEDGTVLSGLIKQSEGAQIVIVDQKGKEIKIAADSVAEKKSISTSPMPANLHQVLDDQQTRNLLAYLLSLTH